MHYTGKSEIANKVEEKKRVENIEKPKKADGSQNDSKKSKIDDLFAKLVSE